MTNRHFRRAFIGCAMVALVAATVFSTACSANHRGHHGGKCRYSQSKKCHEGKKCEYKKSGKDCDGDRSQTAKCDKHMKKHGPKCGCPHCKAAQAKKGAKCHDDTKKGEQMKHGPKCQCSHCKAMHDKSDMKKDDSKM